MSEKVTRKREAKGTRPPFPLTVTGSPNPVYGNVLTLPVATPRHTEPTLRAIKHLQHVTNSAKKSIRSRYTT